MYENAFRCLQEYFEIVSFIPSIVPIRITCILHPLGRDITRVYIREGLPSSNPFLLFRGSSLLLRTGFMIRSCRSCQSPND